MHFLVVLFEGLVSRPAGSSTAPSILMFFSFFIFLFRWQEARWIHTWSHGQGYHIPRSWTWSACFTKEVSSTLSHTTHDFLLTKRCAQSGGLSTTFFNTFLNSFWMVVLQEKHCTVKAAITKTTRNKEIATACTYNILERVRCWRHTHGCLPLTNGTSIISKQRQQDNRWCC